MLYLSLSKNQTDKLGHIQSARNYLKKIPMKKPRVRRESSINKIFNSINYKNSYPFVRGTSGLP